MATNALRGARGSISLVARVSNIFTTSHAARKRNNNDDDDASAEEHNHLMLFLCLINIIS